MAAHSVLRMAAQKRGNVCGRFACLMNETMAKVCKCRVSIISINQGVMIAHCIKFVSRTVRVVKTP